MIRSPADCSKRPVPSWIPPPWKREKPQKRDDRPFVELPHKLPPDEPNTPRPKKEDPDRGVVIIPPKEPSDNEIIIKM